MSVLSKSEIRKLIYNDPPLIEYYCDLEEQLQPNGFDLTLKNVSIFKTSGDIKTDNSKRVVSTTEILNYDTNGTIKLNPGTYLVTFNEIVHLPNDIMALARPRSSLLRCGAAIHNAVWDAGYHGRSQALLIVYNSEGFCVQKNARIDQLVFFRLGEETQGYHGKYQGENIQLP